MTGTDKTCEEANMKLPCRYCSYEGKSVLQRRIGMAGHVGKVHSRKQAEYIAQFGPDSEDDFWSRIPTEALRAKQRNQFVEMNEKRRRAERPEPSGSAHDMLISDTLEELDGNELETYEQLQEQLFQAVDRDDTQIPAVSGLAFDMIYLNRLRRIALKNLKANGSKFQADKDFESVIKAVELRIRQGYEALGISRSAQLKRGQQIKSTPAALISGYLDEIERNSAEMLDALALEEKRTFAKTQPRIAQLILSQAPELPKEETDAGAIGAGPLTLEQVLKRSGLTGLSRNSDEPAESIEDELPQF